MVRLTQIVKINEGINSPSYRADKSSGKTICADIVRHEVAKYREVLCEQMNDFKVIWTGVSNERNQDRSLVCATLKNHTAVRVSPSHYLGPPDIGAPSLMCRTHECRGSIYAQERPWLLVYSIWQETGKVWPSLQWSLKALHNIPAMVTGQRRPKSKIHAENGTGKENTRMV